MKKPFVSLLAATALSAAIAQPAAPVQPLGSAVEVKGLVTISQGNVVANAAPGSPLFNGARVMTTSTGSATLRLAGGCVVSLAANQMVVVNEGVDCRALVASVQPVGPAVAAAATGAGAGAGTPAALVVGPVLAGMLVGVSMGAGMGSPVSGN